MTLPLLSHPYYARKCASTTTVYPAVRPKSPPDLTTRLHEDDIFRWAGCEGCLCAEIMISAEVEGLSWTYTRNCSSQTSFSFMNSTLCISAHRLICLPLGVFYISLLCIGRYPKGRSPCRFSASVFTEIRNSFSVSITHHLSSRVTTDKLNTPIFHRQQ